MKMAKSISVCLCLIMCLYFVDAERPDGCKTKNCENNSDCCQPWKCMEKGGNMKCCAPKGKGCNNNKDCCEEDEKCDKDSGTCMKPCGKNGEECEKNKDCCSKNCKDGICCEKNNEECKKNSDCCSGNCDKKSNMCMKDEGSDCKKDGAKCKNNKDCCSKKCDKKKNKKNGKCMEESDNECDGKECDPDKNRPCGKKCGDYECVEKNNGNFACEKSNR